MSALSYHLGAKREGSPALHPSTKDRWPFRRNCPIAKPPHSPDSGQLPGQQLLSFWPYQNQSPKCLPCLLLPTPAFIFCSLDAFYPWVIRERGVADGCFLVLRHSCSFSKNLPEVSPIEIAFVIQTSFPGLKKSPFYRLTSCLHFFSVHAVCIQSLVPPSVPWLAKLSSGQGKAAFLQGQHALCFRHETLASCFSPK